MFSLPRSSLMAFLLICNLILPTAQAVQRFEETLERDVPIKKTLLIYLQHRLGNVSIQGWVQDRIRVTLKKRVLADNEALAKKEFQKLDLISLETANSFELRVGHAKGVDLVSKMRDVASSQVQVDIEIKAPYQSDLTVVLGDEKTLKLQEWRGGVKVTGKNSSLQFSKLFLSNPIFVNCAQCGAEIRESKLEGHLLLGSKAVLLTDVDGKGGLSIDEGNEEVKIENSRGNISVHSRGGRLTVNKFMGSLRFQSSDGGAYVNQFTGQISVQTLTGQVMLDMDPGNNIIDVDTERSDVQLLMPANFSGGLDLMSLRGEIVVQYSYESEKSVIDTYGPASPGRIEGTIGSDHKIRIHAYSKQGGVRILRKAVVR